MNNSIGWVYTIVVAICSIAVIILSAINHDSFDIWVGIFLFIISIIMAIVTVRS